ncbi:hypothetical protein CSW08_05060 [Confluentibacter flavum]|uniref:GOLD domain-containing protein n=2 Tax=Confluentibacter flavum TaxID=1909700 RepID=A0A2N3HMF3_9FLAO|nr:hypothetical protein CSW08_05060 [Confluentibacter flavum]
MFFFGMKTLIKKYRSRTIAELNFTENPSEIYIKKTGTYAVCIIGGGYANNKGDFDLHITNNGNKLDVLEKQMKFKFRHKGKLATEFYHFEIKNMGKYKFEFKNIADLEAKESMLLSKRMFQNTLSVNNVGIVIKETSSNTKFIIGLLMAVFGFNIAGLGIILAFNPQLYM